MNVDTMELYQDAQREDIPIIPFDIPENGSMCIQSNLRCYIGMDYDVLENEASKRVHLAHELGHCITGSFYNIWAERDVRQKHELRADKWAIERMIPAEALEQAVSEGYTDIWTLAEYFNVTEEFMKKAVCWHTNGNLDTEVYWG